MVFQAPGRIVRHWFPLEFSCLFVFSAGLKLSLDIIVIIIIIITYVN